ncbi:MAG: glycosyl hydrolase family 35, partial [Streptomyces sp.]|nr:glycosyl hydrolase family 35 [Streptomyces sp.]
SFCWPLRLDVGGVRVEWATAQPVCTVEDDGRTVLVLAAVDGIAPEVALVGAAAVSAPSGEVSSVDGRVLVTGVRAGTDALVEVETVGGERVGLLVLDAATARTAYRGVLWGAERLVLADGGVVFDADEMRVHSAVERPSYAVFPSPRTGGVRDGVFTRFVLGERRAVGDASVRLVRAAGPAPEPVTGVMGRASVPEDKWFETVAAEYVVSLPDEVPGGTLLRIHWAGDVGRAYVGDVPVADQFFSGRVWDIGLDRVPEGELRVRVLPGVEGDGGVYVAEGGRRDIAVIERVELVTVRRWAVG